MLSDFELDGLEDLAERRTGGKFNSLLENPFKELKLKSIIFSLRLISTEPGHQLNVQ